MLATFQGGGPGSDDEDMASPFNGKRFTAVACPRGGGGGGAPGAPAPPSALAQQPDQ